MKTQASLADLLFPNQYRRKVMALLWMRPGQWIHLREVARLTGTAPGTLKKELDELCHVDLLLSQRIGNQVQFSTNTAHPVFPELQALIRKTVGLGDVLREGLAPLAERIELAFVFGSMASATENANSDIDLLIVGEADFSEVINALYDAQTRLGREINPKLMSRAEWQDKRAAGNAFVLDVLAKPRLLLIGDESAC